jgi:VWFA-related protein
LHLPGSTLLASGLVFYCAATLFAQTASGAAPRPQSEAVAEPQTPALAQRPLSRSDAAHGLINLDVVVTDNSGRPVFGLRPEDFTLLDNGQAQKILSFSGFDGNASKPDPLVAVILVIDTIGIPGHLHGFVLEEVEKFLRRNGGHLAERVTIFGLSDNGFWTLAQPSGDGNALASEIAGDRLVFIRRWNPFESIAVREPAGLKALKALGHIATVERRNFGKKLLLWVGPGSGIGTARDFETRDPKPRTFNTIYWFSNLLREARISLFSITVGQTDPETGSERYMLFRNGVESAQQASLKNLDRKVLAVQSGGRVLGPGNDLVREIDTGIQEASAFYTLSFDPPRADHPAEYHSLHVQIREPGVTARTNTGYYDQPYYSDQANLAVKRVTVEQLERALVDARGESDAELARRLSDVELSERLSEAKLSSWTASLRGKRARQALVALADESAFLKPPPSEVFADAPPDADEQRSMISLAVDYLNKTIPKLPNFYATRTKVRYEETPQLILTASTAVDYQPLHAAASSKATVLYRNGKEVVDSSGAKGEKREAADGNLLTYGVFGPVLRVVTDAITTGLTWNRWEQGADEPHAVFVYQIPAEKSRYQAGACCLPDGDGTSSFEETVGYHGEIAIDPASGAILRLELVADLKSTTPLLRSDIMIEYGPVEIGGKTYICPVRSVSISRARSVTLPTEWDESFRTYGPYATMLNDVAFERYHIFRAKSRMLPGFSSTQQERSVPPKSQ